MKYFKCGKILKPHGIKGDMKIQSMTDFDRFFNGNKLYILHNDEYIEVELENVREFGEYYLLCFKGMNDINMIEKYHSDYLCVSELDREKLPEGQYYYNELIGKDVYNEKGELKGTCKDIEEYPKNKCLVVVTPKGKRVLIPIIMNEFIKEVLEDRIIINEIEGLF
ncbi:MAG: 16S rRNA processing protein RimM [Acholeplasmatales bacterium]|nr:16S rRNA processing protein RimM [Acholeplasmatales bacterium]